MSKAILVVSFGTSVPSARKNNIQPVVEAITNEFSDFEVRQAYTSRFIINKLRKQGEEVYNEVEAMEQLIADGYTEIYVQSLHVVGGAEFNKMKKNLRHFLVHHKEITCIFGRPLLFFSGQEEYCDDYKQLLEALGKDVQWKDQEGALFIGHGGLSPENTAYSLLQMKAYQEGYSNFHMGLIESYPTIDDLLQFIKKERNYKHIHLYPLLLVVGDHALNDIMGDEEDSTKNILINEGYEVTCHPIGLGARPEVVSLYVEHLRDAMERKNSYKPFM